MGKHICFTLIIASIVCGLWMGLGTASALAADVEFSEGSALEDILKRGELRIGLEVGYMPFEMIDNAAGCARRRSGTAAPDAKGVN
jgi:hypothetical protein